MTGSGEVTINGGKFGRANREGGRDMCRVIRTNVTGGHEIVRGIQDRSVKGCLTDMADLRH